MHVAIFLFSTFALESTSLPDAAFFALRYFLIKSTYHNQLKRYVKSLTDAAAIQSVRYGQELEGEYLDAYNTLMAQAKTQLDSVLAKVSQMNA